MNLQERKMNRMSDMIDSTREDIVWTKPIEGYEEYILTENGMVWSKKYKRWLKTSIDESGYVRVVLCKNRKLKTFFLHRLLFETFVRKLEPNEDCHHIDHNPQNNRLQNLKPVDRIEHRRNHHIGIKQPKRSEYWIQRHVLWAYKKKDPVTGRFIKNASTKKAEEI